MLVGHSSGATLVYGILAQAPANTFKGVISLGFCPDIEIDRPLCDGSGLKSHVLKPGVTLYLESCPKLTAPFIVLEGMIDQVCPYEDTQKYFWNEKQPEEASGDISLAIEHYMQQWKKNSFILIGYSFGADIIPFIANNLPDSLKDDFKGVYCFSPSEKGDFEIHVSDMLSLQTDDKYNVPDEVQKIKSLNPVCNFGDQEDDDLRDHFSVTGSKIEILRGSDHYSNDFNAISAIIFKDLSPD